MTLTELTLQTSAGPLLAFLIRRGGVSEDLASAAIGRGGAFVGHRKAAGQPADVRAMPNR